MKRIAILLTLFSALIISGSFVLQKDFLEDQKKNQRVKTAFTEKGKLIENKLKANNISLDDLNILFVAYKAEKQLELYAKNSNDRSYKLINTYDICYSSGELGPKRKSGDYQVPEGFYYIDRFNPYSNFYLSLGISYPNKSDRIKNPVDPGGDIFIHGSCVTIGCLPMMDDFIKEIYLYAIHAKQNGQNIPVYMFPFKMTDKNFNSYKAEYKNTALISFWNNLKTGYAKFEGNKTALKYSINDKGNYIFE